MTRQAILDLLRSQAPALRSRYAVESLALFGSMARGDDHEGSDVDLFVIFNPGGATFDNFMGLKLDLEDLCGRRVDLVTPNSIRAEIRARIEEDLILVA